jgi:hypothetical protein
MRYLITFLILFSIPLYSQTYLNVNNKDGTNQNALLNSLNKITFSANGDSINYYLPDVGLITSTTGNTQKLTFDIVPLGGVLPVELISFSAKVNQNIVTLMWNTATEVNNYGFEIERQQISSGWNKVGFVNGNGSSNSSKVYSFMDKPTGGTKFQYRLKQIDRNGQYTYSDIIDVVTGIPSKFELQQNYPNPFNPTTKIVYNVPTDGKVSIIVYDIMGREFVSLVNDNKQAGRYELTLDGSHLSSGVYFCRMTARNFTSSIKMLLIK